MITNTRKKIFITLKWIFICGGIGILSGSASAFFLVALEWVTQYRINHNSIIWGLPLGGLIIGLSYQNWGKSVVKGNNLLIEEYANPDKKIPLKMAPLIFFGTLVTHLFGGSAGREGTAVQMGGAIADQFTGIFKLNNSDRKTILILGISAGFASIFGTPLAGALFALEIVFFSTINWKSIVLSFLTAYIAYFTVAIWQVKHTQYDIPFVPEMNLSILCWVFMISILFGLAAMVFSRSTHLWNTLFSKTIAYAPLRPFVGGIILAIAFFLIGNLKYEGLGVPVIVSSFSSPSEPYDFLIKIVLTSFTLGAGFKGGEVTPLFFIGATLGSALSLIVPLPIALLAGMGFVAVFCGATHTPVACTVMGIELFGTESAMYIAMACIIAYFASGSMGIYTSQVVKGAKHHLYIKIKTTALYNRRKSC